MRVYILEQVEDHAGSTIEKVATNKDILLKWLDHNYGSITYNEPYLICGSLVQGDWYVINEYEVDEE